MTWWPGHEARYCGQDMEARYCGQDMEASKTSNSSHQACKVTSLKT